MVWVVRFHVTSYRRGLPILQACGAYDEICGVLQGISVAEVVRRRDLLQSHYNQVAKDKGRPKATVAGMQKGLNQIMNEEFHKRRKWEREVSVFDQDPGARKGMWTIDFHRRFGQDAVGLEVTFNHAEAMPWTLVRPTLAHEAEDARREARVTVGAVILPTDHLKGNSTTGFNMDSAVGTYERLRTLLPKMRSVLPAPFVFFGLDLADGGMHGHADEISLHTSSSGLRTYQ